MSEKHSELTVKEFAERLGSAEPAPGGGAAAALVSALGAALVMMVANLTIGKKEYAEFEALNRDILAGAEALRARLLESTDRDAEAFCRVSAAFRMPKGSERDAAVAQASIEAAEAPLAVMEDSLAVLRLAAIMPGRSNRNLVSDVYVAARSLHAGIMSSLYNVEANLPAIEKADAALAEELRSRAASVASEADRLLSEVIPH